MHRYVLGVPRSGISACPVKTRDIPNLISILRILLVAPTVYYLLNQEYRSALVLFVIAGLSDGLDGLLARHFKWQTRLGAILDPIGDKLLMVSCYLALGWLGNLPAILVMLVILRDVIIVTGAVLYHLLIESVPIQPVMISKVNTALQLTLVVLVIFAGAELPLSSLVSPSFIEALIWLVYVTTVASGLVYVFAWGGRAMSAARNRSRS